MTELTAGEVKRRVFLPVTQICNRFFSVIGIPVHNCKYTDEWDIAVAGSQRPIYTSYIVHAAYKVNVICSHLLKQ